MRYERLRICSSPGTRTWIEPSRNHAAVSRAEARAAASMPCSSSVCALASVSARLAPIRPVFSGVMTKSAPASRAAFAWARTKATFSAISLLTLVWIRPALNAVMDASSTGLGKKRVELTGLLQRREFVGAADMLAVDEDLWHGRAAGALAHLGALGRVFHHVGLFERCALLLQQGLGAGAVAAPRRGVDLDLGHAETPCPDYYAGRTTRASVRTSTCRAPARCRTRVHASTVAPVVSTSSTRTTALPLTFPAQRALISKARRTFVRRSSAFSPACEPVQRARCNRSGTTGRPPCWATERASRRAWL